MKTILVTFLTLCSFCLMGQDKVEKKLIGLWQNSPEYVSGWMDCYQFFPDKTYVFNFDIVNCQENCSTYYYKGNWKVLNDTLILSVKEKKITVGGEFTKVVEDDGVIRILTSGTDCVINYAEPKILNIKLLMMLPNRNRECIKLDDNRYWKMDDNPNAYE